MGVDLHKRFITACALDATGGVISEARRMPVSLQVLGDFLGVLPAPVTVGMEATLYWQWLHDQLEGAGLPLIWRASCAVYRRQGP